MERFEVGKVYNCNHNGRYMMYKVVARNDKTNYITFMNIGRDGEVYGEKIARKVCNKYDCYDFEKVCVNRDFCVEMFANDVIEANKDKKFCVKGKYVAKSSGAYITYKVVSRDEGRIQVQACSGYGMPVGCVRDVEVGHIGRWYGACETADIKIDDENTVRIFADNIRESEVM